MKIVIAGIGKSGTIALTYKIAAALPNCGVVFEPVQRRPLLETGHDTVVKISLRGEESGARAGSYSDFDRKIPLVRDPRDWLVSTLLYLWYSRVTGRREFRRFIGLLERKEADPGSIDFIDLIPPSMPLQCQLGVLRSAVDMGTDLVGQGWYRFHYEEMFIGEFTGLDGYLGFVVAAQAEVAAKHRRVVRSKAAGNWPHGCGLATCCCSMNSASGSTSFARGGTSPRQSSCRYARSPAPTTGDGSYSSSSHTRRYPSRQLTANS